ncbi:MAG: DUF983 domain-containing protein [Lutibacter sp.]|nr:DUF983 domain-containing protein [Lutibacter sp.]
MIKKGTKAYSILYNKCPQCQEGDFMKERNLLKLLNAFDMHEHCSACKLKYMIEPSFFYGAMYMNYALTVGIGIVVLLITTLLLGLTLLESIAPIVLVLILTIPLSIRLSRIAWINLFVHYDPGAANAPESD